MPGASRTEGPSFSCVATGDLGAAPRPGPARPGSVPRAHDAYSRSKTQPLTPTLSPEYGGEGVKAPAPGKVSVFRYGEEGERRYFAPISARSFFASAAAGLVG